MEPHDFIDMLGVKVVRVPPPNGWWGAWCPKDNVIYLHPCLSPSQEKLALAHEFAHVYLGHDGSCGRWEREADELAARTLIRICAWKKAVQMYDCAESVAAELEVHPHAVRVFHEYMLRRPWRNRMA